MPFIATKAQPMSYDAALRQITTRGWIMVAEGPSGAQLREPKKMTGQNKACLVLGALLLIVWGVGLLLILLVVIQHYMLQKERNHFLSRETPRLP